MKQFYNFIAFYVIAFIAVIFLNNTVGAKIDGVIYISKGKTGNSTINVLYDRDYIYDRLAFKILKYIVLPYVKSGEYAINRGDSSFTILNKIKNNDVFYRKITVVEGTSIRQLQQQLESNKYISGYPKLKADMLLLADTYVFQRGDDVNDIIGLMDKNFQNKMNLLWRKRGKKLPFDDYHSAYTLASMVQKEAGKSSEMGLVASVFVNRLNIRMRLQSDPTVIYAVSAGYGKINRLLSKADLKVKSPYNTYYTKGLPPNPIAIVGTAALVAVLNPPKSQYFYFVADGKGGHNFAKDLQQHNQNVKLYRKLKQQ